jgi:prepilin-type N-terminal cleavage/methylation domain-containing protein
MKVSSNARVEARAMKSARKKAFTLIEIMMVILVVGLMAAIGFPAFTRMLQKEGMRKATSDFLEALSQARANAILSGGAVELVMHPRDKTFSVGSAAASTEPGDDAPPPPKIVAKSVSGTFPESIEIEILGINFIEYQEEEEARIKFFPNGTSDEFTMILRSDKGEYRKISLEVLTALADMEVVR